jgi:hypothetical protein
MGNLMDMDFYVSQVRKKFVLNITNVRTKHG